VNVYPFIEAEKQEAGSVLRACRLLEVSRSAFYAHRAGPSRREVDDGDLTAAITTIHSGSGGTYGSPRVHAELADQGHRHSRKRVARLMRAAGLEGREPKRFTRTTIPDPGVDERPDLIRRAFAPDPGAINTRWCGDITYIRTWEGWLYLATVIDLDSRRVVGWATGDHMRTDLIAEALTHAVATRHPGPGVIFHSDRGSQGEFRGSSQHLDQEVARGVTWKIFEAGSDGPAGGRASAVGGGSRVAACDAFTWTAGAFSCGGAGVLAVDRPRGHQRGRGRRGGRVDTGRDEVVSTRWRDATDQPRRALRPLLVVC